MVDCNIYNVSFEAFKGLEPYLHTLDISNNNITEFPVLNLQQNFKNLLKLRLRDNKIKNVFPIYNVGSEKKKIKSTDKKKNEDKKEHEENKGVDIYHEFHSLQEFDFSGWNNGPLQINIINGYEKQRSNK